MKEIHFFRAGRHTAASGADVDLSRHALADIAERYDPKVHEAPIVIGHPKDDARAFGWVERVEARSDGLYAIPRQVNAEFADLVREGAFKKVSASFYAPHAKNHPQPGSWYLRHIGFLGAQPPAVKGLAPIDLSEHGDGVVNLEDGFVDLREHRLNEREREFKRREIAGELKRLNREGRIPKGDLDGLAAFFESLTDADVVEFADDDGSMVRAGQAEWFMDYLRVRPIMVQTGELAAGEGEDFSDPTGIGALSRDEFGRLDPMDRERYAAILAYQKQHGVSFIDAAKALDVAPGGYRP